MHFRRLTACLALSALALSADANVYPVTNTLDSGPGSLRQAILDSNANPGHDLVWFSIGPGGAVAILPLEALPPVTDPVTIDGTTQAGYAGTPLVALDGCLAGASSGLVLQTGGCEVRGLRIIRFAEHGIRSAGADFVGNLFTGNHLGAVSAATAGQGNGGFGLALGGRDRAGGSLAEERNVVGGNGLGGVRLSGPDAVVEGNYVGLSMNGLEDSGNLGPGVVAGLGAARATIRNNSIVFNRAGIRLLDGSFHVAEANVIYSNAEEGIRVEAPAESCLLRSNIVFTNGAGVSLLSSGNLVSGSTIRDNRGTAVQVGAPGLSVYRNRITANYIYTNQGLGIDLDGDGVNLNDPLDADAGSNGLQNFPKVKKAHPVAGKTRAIGSLQAAPSTTYRIEFFASVKKDPTNFGEGQTYLGFRFVTTDATGTATYEFQDLPPVQPDQFMTATATDPYGNTSEFAKARLVTWY